MTKGVHAAIAVFVAVLVAAGIRGVGSPVRGVGDDVVSGLFGLGLIAVFIFGIWFAFSTLTGSSRGGGGGSGVSPADFDALKTAVDTGFTSMQERISAVKVDTEYTKVAVDEVKVSVGRLGAVLGRWAPALDDLNATVGNLLQPVQQSVDEIKAGTLELKEWADKKWKKFSDDITSAVGGVFEKVKTVDTDLAALKGAVGKLETGQQDIAAVVDDIKKKQSEIVSEARAQFGELPASVAAKVKEDITGMKDALSLQIGKVAESQERLEGLLANLMQNFGRFERALERQLEGVESRLAGRVRADATAIYRALAQQLSGLAQRQTDTSAAVANLTAMQMQLRQHFERAFQGLPASVAQALKPEIDRVEQSILQEIRTLEDEQKRTIGAVGGLDAVAKAQAQLVIQRMEELSAEHRKDVEAQIDDLSLSIANDLEPLRTDMAVLRGQINDVLRQIDEVGSSVDWLHLLEGERFGNLKDWIASAHALLYKVEQEGAKQETLVKVQGDVASIVDWLGKNGAKLSALGDRLPALGPLLDRLNELVDKLKEKQKKAKEKTDQAVKRQQGLILRIGRAYFNHTTYDANALVFLTELVQLRQSIVADAKVADIQWLLKAALPQLTSARNNLCIVPNSSYEQLNKLIPAVAKLKMEFPPTLADELAVLTGLCSDKGGVSQKYAELVRLAGLARPAKNAIIGQIDGIIRDKCWSEVAGKLTRDLFAVYEAQSRVPP